jgi:hypothetical protein
MGALVSAPAEDLEHDPETDFAPRGEERVMVLADHPVHGCKMTCQVLRKRVDQDGNTSYMVRWGRYWLKEDAESDCEVTMLEDVTREKATVIFFQHFMTFAQVVGSPSIAYQVGEEVDLRDAAGVWHKARILGAEATYYNVKMDKSKSATEWVHKFSARLRKLVQYEHVDMSADDYVFRMWATFSELDWVRVRHPTANQYLVARVVEVNDKSMTVLFDAPGQLIQQEVIQRAVVEEEANKYLDYIERVNVEDEDEEEEAKDTGDGGPEEKRERAKVEPPRIEDFLNPEKRRRFHRSTVYTTSMRAAGMIVRRMDTDNGHSLFRALSEQIFGSSMNHAYLRTLCIDHISMHSDYFRRFVDINLEMYVARKRKATQGDFLALGDHLDIQAVCEIFDTRVEIYSELSTQPLRPIRFYQQFSRLPIIRLSYRGHDVYDSVQLLGDRLPVTVVHNLERLPLGRMQGVTSFILKARQELCNQVDLMNSTMKAHSRHCVEVAVYSGAVYFPKEQARSVLIKIFQAVNLPEAVKQLREEEAPENDTLDYLREQMRETRVFQSKSNKRIVIVYPDAAIYDDDEPRFCTMRIEGERPYVERAVALVREHAKANHLTLQAVRSVIKFDRREEPLEM